MNSRHPRPPRAPVAPIHRGPQAISAASGPVHSHAPNAALLIDFDDDEAVGLFDHSPLNAAIGEMPRSDCPASRSVIGAVLFFPGHANDGFAFSCAAFAAAALRRLPTASTRELGLCALS